MSPAAVRPTLIELKLRDVEQLFNTMDPSPFHDKDLDSRAEEFIASWAREHPLSEKLALRVHLERWPEKDPKPIIEEAVHNYFAAREHMADLEFRQLMRRGRISLVIGVVFLAACLIAAELLARPSAGIARYLGESFRIAGWVAMWGPMEIYLYDWWPLRSRRRHFARLATMPVDVVKAAIRTPA